MHLLEFLQSHLALTQEHRRGLLRLLDQFRHSNGLLAPTRVPISTSSIDMYEYYVVGKLRSKQQIQYTSPNQ